MVFYLPVVPDWSILTCICQKRERQRSTRGRNSSRKGPNARGALMISGMNIYTASNSPPWLRGDKGISMQAWTEEHLHSLAFALLTVPSVEFRPSHLAKLRRLPPRPCSRDQTCSTKGARAYCKLAIATPKPPTKPINEMWYKSNNAAIYISKPTTT